MPVGPGSPVAEWQQGKGAAIMYMEVSPNSGDAPTLTNGLTITVNAPVMRVTNGGAVTGILMTRGLYHGQLVFVINNGSGSITFASVATSLVLDGANVSIPTLRMGVFVWDSVAGNWVACESTT